MTIEKFLGHYEIQNITEGQVYYCEEGCGECQKITIDTDNMTKHCKDDLVLIERHYSKIDVSSCCKSNVGIWDESLDSEIEAEYTFIPANV